MVPKDSIPQAIIEYLQLLELELKKIPGVSPEEALSDAREYLVEDFAALKRSGEEPEEQSHFDWIVSHYGNPSQVAAQYGNAAPSVPLSRIQGYAPGWRICCTDCGRSAPLAALGGIRIGARSYHKYTRSYCHHCLKSQFLHIIRDLDKTNLTRKLIGNQTTDQVRSAMHKPVATIATILALVFVSLSLIATVTFLLLMLPMSLLAQESIVVPTDTISKLRNAVGQHYSYRDLRGIDWEKRLSEYETRIQSSKSNEQLGKEIADCLSVARDMHVFLEVDHRVVSSFSRGTSLNFNPRILPRVTKSLKQHGKTILTGKATDRIHYVAISTWDHRELESMKAAKEFVESCAIAQVPLIIDVRPNSGGDENQAREIASYFVREPTPYASNRNWIDGKAGPLNRRVLQPSLSKVHHPGPCVVLMGPNNMSSCESFLSMMRHSGATLVGMPSYGSSGNPKPHELGSGIVLYLPSWQECDLDGNLIEGRGLRPDILVDWNQEKNPANDLVLAKAVELLSK